MSRIESPCISVCMINAEDERCYGCFRTLEEIANWTGYSEAERKHIMAQLEHRREAHDPRTEL